MEHGLDLSWLNLVRKSVGVVDGVEGSAEVVGKGVGSGDDVLAGLDLDGPVAAGGADELPDRPGGGGIVPGHKAEACLAPSLSEPHVVD